MRTAAYSVPVFALLSLASGSLLSQERENLATFRVYEAATEKWQKTVSFHCTYTVEQGYAADLESAVAGKIVHLEDGNCYRASGTFAKSKDVLRYSKTYVGGEVQVPGSNNETRNLSYDELGKQDVELRVHNSNANHSSLWLSPRRPRLKSSLSPGVHAEGEVCPLSIPGGRIESPFAIFTKASLISAESVAIEQVDSSHLAVRLRTRFGPEDVDYQWRFWTEPDLPVIDQVDQISRGPGYDSEAHSRARQFRKCDGGVVASEIVRATKSSGNKNAKLPWVVTKWVSADLGARPVSPSDFLVKVAPQDDVWGVRSFARQSKSDRSLDFLALSLKDIDDPSIAEPAKPVSSFRPWMIAAILGIIALSAAYFGLRYRRNAAQ
jgi:hypothetical protein